MSKSYTICSDSKCGQVKAKECLEILKKSSDFSDIVVQWVNSDRSLTICSGEDDDSQPTLIYFAFEDDGSTVAEIYAPISEFEYQLTPMPLESHKEFLEATENNTKTELDLWLEKRDKLLSLEEYDELSAASLVPKTSFTQLVLSYAVSGWGSVMVELTSPLDIEDWVDEENTCKDLIKLEPGSISAHYQNGETGDGFGEHFSFYMSKWRNV